MDFTTNHMDMHVHVCRCICICMYVCVSESAWLEIISTEWEFLEGLILFVFPFLQKLYHSIRSIPLLSGRMVGWMDGCAGVGENNGHGWSAGRLVEYVLANGWVCVMEVVSVFVCNCLYVGLHQFMLMSQHCYVNFSTIHIYTHTLLHSHMCVSFFIFFVNFLCFKMLF